MVQVIWALPCENVVREAACACRRPALSGSADRGSGDMMMDGVPGMRAGEWVRPLILSGKSTQQRGGDRNSREPAAGITDLWAGHVRIA